MQAFFVGTIGSVALAVVFGIAADYLPVWAAPLGEWRVWQIHLMCSAVLSIPVGAVCAYLVHQRSTPPTD